jgi:hypothetical protein
MCVKRRDQRRKTESESSYGVRSTLRKLRPQILLELTVWNVHVIHPLIAQPRCILRRFTRVGRAIAPSSLQPSQIASVRLSFGAKILALQRSHSLGVIVHVRVVQLVSGFDGYGAGYKLRDG